MFISYEIIKSFVKSNLIRIFYYYLLVVVIAAFTNSLSMIRIYKINLAGQDTNLLLDQKKFNKALLDYRAMKKVYDTHKKTGVDVSVLDKEITAIEIDLYKNHNYKNAKAKTLEVTNRLGVLLKAYQEAQAKAEQERLAAEKASKTGVTGLVTGEAGPLNLATINIYQGGKVVSTTKTGADGRYTLNIAAGNYVLNCSRSGYNSFKKNDLTIVDYQISTVDIQLSKYVPVPKPAPAPSGSNSANGFSSYSREVINTSAGSFTIDIVRLNLASGHIRVITDTANSEDCTNNCPTKPLASYVSQHGAFAGINGTYFCPADYASCAGQTNSFFWKVYNTPLGKIMNGGHPYGNTDPFMIFDGTGKATYLHHWYEHASYSFTAGINCAPRLVEGGVSVLDNSSLDAKQLGTKSNRGALGLKGQELYAIVAKSATIPNMNAILLALGVDYAINLDGGGSSALYYGGAYKVGPGRSLPNAVVFAAQ